MDDGKRGVDQISFFHLLAFDDEIFQQAEEFQLPTAKCGVGADELRKGCADFIGKAVQQFNAEYVTDELNEACLAIFVNLLQQRLGDVRVFFVQKFRQFIGLCGTHEFAVLDFLQYWIVCGQFGNELFDHFAVASDADGFVLRTELDPLFLV